MAARIRGATAAPLLLMTYYNLIHHYGHSRFVRDALQAGLDGVIIPDLPSGEAAPLLEVAQPGGIYLIQMVAPTTTADRLAEVGRTARGFVYCVSLLGTTGARAAISDRLPSFMANVHAHVRLPLMVGFGISRPEHVAAVRQYADAVAVGGAIADLLRTTPRASCESALAAYVSELRAAGAARSAVP